MKKKTGAVLMSMLCLTTLFAMGFRQEAKAETQKAPDSICVYGTVSENSEGRLTIARQDNQFDGQELIITISDETRVLDAVTGFPMEKGQIRDGEFIYAYIGPAMTLSLPPISNASLVLANIPADFRVPELVTSASLTVNENGSGSMTGTNGTVYTIPAGIEIIPYLTRNMVTIRDLSQGATSLVWLESSGSTAYKVVIFPDGQNGTDVQPSAGWYQDNGTWYYKNSDASLHKGWLSENGSWYYLDTENGAMRTGFLTVEGKTYYLNEDGKMLTKSRTFTPDENGALH